MHINWHVQLRHMVNARAELAAVGAQLRYVDGIPVAFVDEDEEVVPLTIEVRGPAGARPWRRPGTGASSSWQ
jgi:hypothetical protein